MTLKRRLRDLFDSGLTAGQVHDLMMSQTEWWCTWTYIMRVYAEWKKEKGDEGSAREKRLQQFTA